MMGKLAAILNSPIKTISLTNTVTNGAFVNTTGWTATGSSFFVASNEAYFVANSTNDTLSQLQSITSGRKYYFCGYVKSSSSSVALRLSDSISYADGQYHSGSGNYEFLSFVYTAVNTTTTAALFVVDGRSSAWDTINAKYFSMIDVTTAFGAGNEPTKETMDFIMTQWSNNWLNGTQTASYY